MASACLDQLSVWYLYGSNFSQCIWVMVLCCPPIVMHKPTVFACVIKAPLPASETHSDCVPFLPTTITTLRQAHFRLSSTDFFSAYHKLCFDGACSTRAGPNSAHTHSRTWTSGVMREGVWIWTRLWFVGRVPVKATLMATMFY